MLMLMPNKLTCVTHRREETAQVKSNQRDPMETKSMSLPLAVHRHVGVAAKRAFYFLFSLHVLLKKPKYRATTLTGS